MKNFLLLVFVVVAQLSGIAQCKDGAIPFQRIRFYDRIKEEQAKLEKADGRADSLIKVGNNPEINQAVTNAFTERIQEICCAIENNPRITSNNDKIRQLNYVEELVRQFRMEWKGKRINPAYAPLLVQQFEKVLQANLDSQSMAPFIAELPYQEAALLSDLFPHNSGFAESQKIIYQKFAAHHPDKILATIRPFQNESFADSLVVLACKNNPKQLYDYASSPSSAEAKLIRRNTHPMVMAVAKLGQTPNALRYYPFLDDILNGRQSIDSLKRFADDGPNGYDSVGYYKQLVKTAIAYHERLIRRDTPIAMFGTNGLREMLYTKALKHFITPINELHDQNNLAVRMKAIQPLSAEELFYMIVMGENDIYTSSYKHSFTRLLQLMGPQPRTDKLLMNVKMDYFKKFIKMAANFNHLDTVLKLMPEQNANTLMRAFVSNLDEGNNLEDAVDVADSYSSITNVKLQQNMLQNVADNEATCIKENNQRGKVIYNLLSEIFKSFNDNSIDLTARLGIPSIFSLDYNYLADEKGRVVQQVFFYGDDDGKVIFPAFLNTFSAADWKITHQKEWVEIKSLKGKPVFIYANKPLNSDQNLDDSAQAHLNQYLSKMDISPSVVVHRGHSYWLPGTIKRMPGDAKIIVLGSCGGYKNLSEILDSSPDAHIISTKEIGKGDINRPILNYINNTLKDGKTLVWKDMWASLTKLFYADPNKGMRESWDDYVPPFKNLGVIFIKAYNKKMEADTALVD